MAFDRAAITTLVISHDFILLLAKTLTENDVIPLESKFLPLDIVRPAQLTE